MSTYYEAPDADSEPTLWRAESSDDPRPAALLRRCDLPTQARDLWPLFVASVAGEWS